MTLYNRKGAEALRQEAEETAEAERGAQLTDDFLAMMDRYHAAPEVWDDELDRNIAAMNYEILRNPKKLPWGPRGTRYFSPSSANSCKRELYHKLIGDKRDQQDRQPHQGRWTRMGTAFGDMIQRDLLFIEKHYEKISGEKPPFTVERVEVNGRKFPAWEKFAQTIRYIEHGGHEIGILGQPDGILRYKDGTRIGLEIKSKQTTAAQTGEYKMRDPKDDHVRQCIAYSIMYDVNEFIIVYGNLSKKSWMMSEDEYVKNPDLRAFHIVITETQRQVLLDEFAFVKDCVAKRTPPPVNLEKWAFSSFKTATAVSLTDEEMADIKAKVSSVMKSRLPDWQKRNYYDALKEIEEIREGYGL